MIVLSNKSHSQKCSHRQESKLCCVKMSYINATPNILLYIVPIKEVIIKKPFCRNGYFGPFVFGETTLQPNAYDRKFILFYGFTKLLFTFTIIMQRSWTCGGQKTSISLSAMHTFSFSTIVNFTGDWKCPKLFFVEKKEYLTQCPFLA